MPIYEYECTQCGCRSEVIQKVSDPPQKKCKKCGGVLKKLVSSSAIQFKGSGWYITDYPHKSSPQEKAKGKDEAPAKEPCTPDAPSETKSKIEKKASPQPAEK